MISVWFLFCFDQKIPLCNVEFALFVFSFFFVVNKKPFYDFERWKRTVEKGTRKSFLSPIIDHDVTWLDPKYKFLIDHMSASIYCYVLPYISTGSASESDFEP